MTGSLTVAESVGEDVSTHKDVNEDVLGCNNVIEGIIGLQRERAAGNNRERERCFPVQIHRSHKVTIKLSETGD